MTILITILLTAACCQVGSGSPFDRQLTLAPVDTEAQDAGGGGGSAQPSDASDLAKAAQNPVSDLVSVPLQNNFNFGVGPENGVNYTLNIQPIYPTPLSDKWNLINRAIIPLMYQPQLAPGLGDVFGLGDIQYQPYLSPLHPGKVIWGAGATLSIPTATDRSLGTGKWSAGPGVVVLTMPGHWVLGALANNVWSFAGNENREYVNFLFVQAICNYNLPKGWYLNSIPFITADWTETGTDRWTVPIGGGIGKITRIGRQPVNVQLGAYWNVVRPTDAADWSLRLQVQFMFPK